MSSHSSDSSHPFTVLDWIGTLMACVPVAALLLFPLAGRSFAAMYRDFGSAEHLPRLTMLAVSWWFPLTLGLVPLGAMSQVFRSSTPLQRRRAWAVGAFLLAVVGLAVCLVGVYEPIFDLAGKINADDP